MKKVYLLLLSICFLLIVGSRMDVNAQSVVVVTPPLGTGPNNPFGPNAFAAQRFIYLQSELAIGGPIDTIGFSVAVLGAGSTRYTNVRIFVRHTNSTTIPIPAPSVAVDSTGYTRIYAGNFPVNRLGFINVPTQAVFNYNNTQNLEFLVLRGAQDSAFSTLPTWNTSNRNNSLLRAFSDVALPTTWAAGSINTFRPQLRMVTTPPPCAGTPSAGTLTTGEFTICNGAPLTITASGVSQAPGITYQWESSTDNVAFTPVASATSSSITITSITVPTWYRLAVTCSNSSQTARSASRRVTSTTAPITSLPYFESFDNLTSFPPFPCGWTTINGPAGTPAWSVSINSNVPFSPPNMAVITGGTAASASLVSPQFALDATKTYRFSFRARINAAGTYQQTFEIRLGRSNTADSLNIVDTVFSLPNQQYNLFETVITPPTTGNWHIAIRNTSPANTITGAGTLLDDIAMEEVFPNDAATLQVVGAGRVPRIGVNTVPFFASIRNVGLGGITGMVPTLQVLGTNPQTVSGPAISLSPGNTNFITFPGYVANNNGIDTVIIRVAPDQNGTNDERRFIVQVTNDDYHIHEFNAVSTQGFVYGATSGAFDVFFVNRFAFTGPDSVIITKVRVEIPNEVNLIGVPVSGLVKNAAGVILGQSATRAITASDLGTYMEFSINQIFPVFKAGPGAALFAGIGMNKPAGQVSVPVRARPEPTAPGRPVQPSYSGSPFNAAPSGTGNEPRLYMIEVEVANASAPNRISPFNLSTPVNGTVLNLQGSASTPVNIRWRSAFDTAGLNISYQFLLDQLGFDFSAPVVQASSNNNGTDTVLTLTYEIIDDILDDAGAPLDSTLDIEMIWTARAIAGANAKFAQDTFDIVFRRFGLSYTLCTPNNTGNSNDFIDSVRFTGAMSTAFTNQTGRNVPTQYNDFFGDLTKAVSVNQGASYPFSVRMGALPVVDTFFHQAIVLVDWNKNGRFDEANGRFVTNIAPSTPSLGALLTGNLVIPAGLPNDRYRMRVIGGDTAGALEPCAVDFGDIEDYSLFVGIPVGINPDPKNEVSQLSLYPNPTTGMVQVQYPFSRQRDVTVQVFNSVGALVYNRLDAGVTNNESFIDLSGYSEGVYMVKFITNDATEVRRVVLQK